MAFVEYSDAEGNVKKVEILKGDTPTVLGRSPSCHVVLKSPSVGRNHGKIVYRDGRYFYLDLGSVNGSFVNGKRLVDEIELFGGETIKCGDQEIRFFLGKDEVRREEPKKEPSQREVEKPHEALMLVEIDRLRRENAALRAEVLSLRKAKGGSQEIDSLKTELKEALERANREEARAAEAEKQVQTLTASLEGMHAKYLDLRGQLVEMQRKMDALSLETRGAGEERMENEARIQKLEAQASQASEALESARQEVASLKVKLTEKERELERVRRELDAKEYDLKALREENARLQEYCEVDTGRQKDLERRAKHLEAIIEEHKDVIAGLKRNIEEKERELRSIRMGKGVLDLEEEKKKLLDDFHKKSREADELRDKVEEMERKILELESEADALKEKNKKLEEATRVRKSEREDISDHPLYKAKEREVLRLVQEVEEVQKEMQRVIGQKGVGNEKLESAQRHAENCFLTLAAFKSEAKGLIRAFSRVEDMEALPNPVKQSLRGISPKEMASSFIESLELLEKEMSLLLEYLGVEPKKDDI
jgi:pSer/pThr/pTyr-binding forkhead associated (FHA) protein